MTIMVVDGYNVIYAVPELRRQLDQSLEAARNALISHCRAYRARRGDVQRIYVVFDGAQEERDVHIKEAGGVHVVFTSRHEEADAQILTLIKAERGAHRFLIVSNDTEVFNNARAHGARAISVTDFYPQHAPARVSGRGAGGDPKAHLPAAQARHITDEYRQHLERRKGG